MFLKLCKFFLSIVLISVVFSNAFVCFAGPLKPLNTNNDQREKFIEKAPFDYASNLSGIVSVVVKAFLGLLATIFIILMLKAGYDWMTAQGEEEKVRQAIHTIQRAVIGLLIIAMAYSITYFVMKSMPAGSPSSISGTAG